MEVLSYKKDRTSSQMLEKVAQIVTCFLSSNLCRMLGLRLRSLTGFVLLYFSSYLNFPTQVNNCIYYILRTASHQTTTGLVAVSMKKKRKLISSKCFYVFFHSQLDELQATVLLLVHFIFPQSDLIKIVYEPKKIRYVDLTTNECQLHFNALRNTVVSYSNIYFKYA